MTITKIRGKKIDEDLVVHMLGYLGANHFIDAIKMHGFSKDDVLKLASILEDEWDYSLDIEEIIQEMEGKK